MHTTQGNGVNTKWIGLIAVLFGILLLAQQGNELLKHLVIAPGSAAEMGVPADCRADELEEEDLSLLECQLMVSNVQIVLASSPPWFRPLMILISSTGLLFAALSIFAGFSLVSGKRLNPVLLRSSFLSLVVIDIVIFVAISNSGPLLRAQYLWITLIWFFIHLSILAGVISSESETLEEGV